MCIKGVGLEGVNGKDLLPEARKAKGKRHFRPPAIAWGPGETQRKKSGARVMGGAREKKKNGKSEAKGIEATRSIKGGLNCFTGGT